MPRKKKHEDKESKETENTEVGNPSEEAQDNPFTPEDIENKANTENKDVVENDKGNVKPPVEEVKGDESKDVVENGEVGTGDATSHKEDDPEKPVKPTKDKPKEAAKVDNIKRTVYL